MSVDVTIPEVGESISEALVSQWLKSEGDSVEQDEIVAELETDKVTLELPAPAAGKIIEIRKKEGESADVGEVIAVIDETATAPSVPAKQAEPEASDAKAEAEEEKPEAAKETAEASPQKESRGALRVMPAAARLLDEHGLEPNEVEATGPGGRLLKEDVERHVDKTSSRPAATPKSAPQPAAPVKSSRAATAEVSLPVREGDRIEEAVPMTPIRKRIAERLVQAQESAALLTTFNEVDMSAVIRLRQQYRDVFLERHEVKLGFMSFFVKATVDALRLFPRLNAEIRGDDILYRNYYDIGIAVSTDRGLLVPVLRNAERLGFAEIEKSIGDFAKRARDGKIKLNELEGGTFTITNGGIFGSMLSTPIINPPQSGVLGLHAIQDRPVAIDGKVEVRPVMYLALTYDHRLVDGREAVTFLRRIKEAIEEPSRMLLEV